MQNNDFTVKRLLLEVIISKPFISEKQKNEIQRHISDSGSDELAYLDDLSRQQMKVIFECSPIEAEVIKGLLEAHGIATYLQKDDCGGMRPSLNFVGGAKVLVNDGDYQAALEILQRDLEEEDE